MSRRPRAVTEQRIARALATMAPGGRLASESPIRRSEGTWRPQRSGGAGIPSNPELQALYLTAWEYETTGGNGAIYPVISLPRTVNVNTTGLGDITGLPCCIVVKTDAYTDLRPPAGWTEAFEYFDGGSHSAAVWTLNAYAGESMVGTLNGSIPVGLSGANYRVQAFLLVGGTPGSFTATLGTPGTALNMTDPGGVYRLQVAPTQVRYDRAWTPALPATMQRFGSIWSGSLINSGSFTQGWQTKAQTDAIMKDLVVDTATHTADVPGSNIPINIVWSG